MKIPKIPKFFTDWMEQKIVVGTWEEERFPRSGFLFLPAGPSATKTSNRYQYDGRVRVEEDVLGHLPNDYGHA